LLPSNARSEQKSLFPSPSSMKPKDFLSPFGAPVLWECLHHGKGQQQETEHAGRGSPQFEIHHPCHRSSKGLGNFRPMALHRFPVLWFVAMPLREHGLFHKSFGRVDCTTFFLLLKRIPFGVTLRCCAVGSGSAFRLLGEGGDYGGAGVLV
jgi:hypothetical protein